MTDITAQVPIVHSPTQLDEVKTKAVEIATTAGRHAKTGARIAGRTWFEVAKTSPQGFHRTASKTLTWIRDERGADRVDTHYKVLNKFSEDERKSSESAADQSDRCEKYEKRHRRRVARRAVAVAVPNAAFIGANVYAHTALPGFAEGLTYLAEAGLTTTVYGVLGNNGAVEVVRRMTTSNKVTPEKLRKALRDLGIRELRKDLEREQSDTDIADFEGDKARGTRTTTVALCSGVQASEVIGRRGRLAANLRKSENQVILAEGAAGHEVIITIYKDDPSARLVETWPLASLNSVNIFDAIPLGVSATGEIITITLGESHLFIAGMSRWGKSVTMQTIAATIALDPRVRIWVWNGTDAATFGFLAPVCEVFVNGNASTDKGTRDKAIRIIEMLNDEMDKRGKILAKLGREKVDNDCAHVEGLNPIVLFMDEIAPLFSKEPTALQDIENFASQCLKFGIHLVSATQTLDKHAVPWSFVGKFELKLAHRIEKESDNQAVFGNEYASRGINAYKIRTKGEAILDGEGHGHQTLRVYLADEQTRTEAVARGLRGRGGVVERIDVTPRQEAPATSKAKGSTRFPTLLDDILSMFEDADEGKLQCRQIVERLPHHKDYEPFVFDPADTEARDEKARELAELLRVILGRKATNAKGDPLVRYVNKKKEGRPTAPGIYLNEITDYLQGDN